MSAEKCNKFRYEQTLTLNKFINPDGPRQSAGWCTKDNNRQAPVCYECCSTSHHQHPEVWSWSLTRPMPWASLAWRRWPHQILTLCQRLQMSTPHSTTILVWALHTGRTDAWTSSSLLCWPLTAAYSKVSADKLWRTFVLLCCPVYMELSDALKDTDLSLASFQKQLKTFLFSQY